MSNRKENMGVNATVLMIDHDLTAVRSLRSELEVHGCHLISARTGSEGLRKARNDSPHVILLDLSLPDIDGLELCRRLRGDPLTATIPIVVASARNGEVDRILTLEYGADDFVPKPFNRRELFLRLRNLFAPEHQRELADALTFGELRIDIPRHNVTVDDRAIPLTLTEFRLLARLVQHKGQVLGRSQLLDDLSDRPNGAHSRTIDTHMRRLRRKLGKSSRFIRTVYRIGYRFVENASF